MNPLLLAMTTSLLSPPLTAAEVAAKADAALAKLKGIQYEVSAVSKTAVPATETTFKVVRSDKGKLLAARSTANDVMGWKIKYTPDPTSQPTYAPGTYTFDGKSATDILMSQKKYIHTINAENKLFFHLVFPNSYRRKSEKGEAQAPFFSGLVSSGRKVQVLPNQKVDGVDCVGLRVHEPTAANAELKSQTRDYYFGAKDFILRRDELNSHFTEAKLRYTLELHKVVLNPTLKPALFQPSVPKGFQVENRDAKEMDAKAKAQQERWAAGEKMRAIGNVMPDFTLTTTDGKAVSLSNQRGKVVVLDFYGTWCGPCNLAFPSLQQLADDMTGKNFQLYGLSCYEAPTTDVAKYMKEKGTSYTVLVDCTEYADLLGVSSFPTVVVLDRKGVVRYSDVGFSEKSAQELKDTVKKLMEEN